MMLKRSLIGLLSVALLAQARSSAAAQPQSSTAQPPQPDAQALFDRGVADMEAGRLEKACPAIEASQRLEPMPGTLFTLAECEAQRGRTATAMRYYGEYLALYRAFNAHKKAEQKDRAVTSEEQLRKLDRLTPRLTLKLPGTPPPDIVVKLDGDVVADLSLGTALAVDPGEHAVTSQVPGGAEIEVRVSLSAGASRTVELRWVSGEPASEPPPGHGPLVLPPATLQPAPPPDLRAWRIGTWSAGATAIVGLAVGTVTGVLALEQRGVMNRNCARESGLVHCNAVGMEAKSRLESFGNASTVGFIAGGVGIGVGAALILATPSQSPTPVQGVGPKPPTGAALPPFSLTLNGKF